jgi:hypothetical protein
MSSAAGTHVVKRRFGVLLAAVVVLLLAARIWLAVAFGSDTVNGQQESLLDQLLLIGAFGSYFVVGFLLIMKRPDNRVGWVLAAIGALTTVGAVAEGYGTFVLAPGGRPDLPGGLLAAWIMNWYWFPLLGLIAVFVPLLFPTGRPLTPRWRWLFYAATGLLVVITLAAWVKPVLTDGSPDNPAFSVINPIGVEAVGNIEKSTVGAVLLGGLLAMAACAVVSLVVRFRRSRGVERQQMKLFVFACTLMAAQMLLSDPLLEKVLPQGVESALFALAIALPPVSIGLAVLRYRLYDIDRLISRSVSYALLTAVLLGLYLGAVTVMSAVGAGVAGQSPAGVAVATLLAAAAFGPARRRIQSLVDRRFNRDRYDAERIVGGYRQRLRDEVELQKVTDELVTAVRSTVQPTAATLWLRGSSEGGAR